MKSKLIILVVILLIVIAFFVQKQEVSNLVTPNINKTTKQTIEGVPNATPNAPKTYNFDSSTDLKTELESVNPQILDSDFE